MPEDLDEASSTAVAEPPGRPAAPAPRRIPAWAPLIIVIAALAVVAGGVWGIRGLFGNPVQGTDAQGVTTIHGSWEPYMCGTPCIGYIQDGGRSVTVILPAGCPQPDRSAGVTVRGRLDPTQGKATYRATGCTSAG